MNENILWLVVLVVVVVVGWLGYTSPPDNPKNGDSCGTDHRPRKKAHC